MCSLRTNEFCAAFGFIELEFQLSDKMLPAYAEAPAKHGPTSGAAGIAGPTPQKN